VLRYAAFILLLATACSSGAHPTVSQRSPSPIATLQHSPALIETDHGSVLFNVELAVTQQQRKAGLMHRNSLGDREGMAFLFFQPSRRGFWMKDTTIPLSVAFFDENGQILKILNMTPCRREPCHVYHPHLRYMGALEVNRGAFARAGVDIGDTVHLAP
jgi:uncharacterized protein